MNDIPFEIRPPVALSIRKPDDPYRHLPIRGVVAGWAREGARQHVDRLTRKYRGWDDFPGWQDIRE